MARITKLQRYAIRWLNHENRSAEDIASELNMTVKQVNSEIEKHSSTNAVNEVKTAQQPASKIKKMLSKTVAGDQKVTIMSQEASLAIQDHPQKNKKHERENYIYRPNN